MLFKMMISHPLPLKQWGWTSAIVLLSWGWAFQFTPAFISVGMLTGMNPAFSWLAGSVLAYGIIGPSLVATGKAFSPVIDEASGYHNNFSMTTVNLPDGTTDPSRGTARYWLLWPGILMMLVASFTDLLIQAPMYYRQGKQLFNQARKTIGEKRGKDMSHITNAVPEASTDPAPPHEQVNNSTWIIGLTIAAVTSMVLAKTEFGVNPGMTLFALILGFVFAFVAATASGTTDVSIRCNPMVFAMTKLALIETGQPNWRSAFLTLSCLAFIYNQIY